ncbi:transmembrane protein 45B [Alosa alosa]|nr:transmembrane protein 45B [Alosa sapidissima]XP_041944997.1 transmembrane protein 45B [Alosa sapidissima]XP_048110919.1 transmembrane protein 45B [Alosa alosa]
MANFKGHALPGSFFLLFGLWWSVKAPWIRCCRQRFITGRKKPPSVSRKIDLIEGSLKVFFAFVGIMAEQFVPDGPHAHLYNGGWVKLMNWQHSTMYLFYGLSGAADILCATSRFAPQGLDRMALALALFVEGFLFYYHLHNRPMLDTHVHSLLLVAVFGGAASTALEVFLRENAVLEILRCSLAILQGSWFYQIGFVLYPLSGPEWDQTDHNNMMFITMCFCWHYAVALLITGVNYAVVWRVVGSCVNKPTSNMEMGLRKNTVDSSQKSLLQESDEE